MTMLRGAPALVLTAVLAACSGSPSPAGATPAATEAPSLAASVPAASSAPPLSTPSTPSATPEPLASVTHSMDDLRANRFIAEVDVGGRPDWQTSLQGALWVTAGGPAVVRIDQNTNKVTARIDVADPCFSLAAGFGSIWSPSCGAGELDRIDPATNQVVARIPLAGIPADGEGQLVVTKDAIWMFTDDHGSLASIDPKRNAVAHTYATGLDGDALVFAEGALWASVPDADAVAQIGLDGKVIRSIPVGRGPRFIAAGEGGIWSLGQGDGDVTRIDPSTGKVVATIQLFVPGSGGCIDTGGGSVWVTMPETPVSRIDAASNTVTERFTGVGGDCISFSDGSVWLSNADLGTVARIRP